MGNSKTAKTANSAKTERYLVPDLTPIDRHQLAGVRPKLVFVAESPHVSEIAPDSIEERRPLCGVAGRKWWSALGEFLEEDPGEDVSLGRMLALCRKHGIAVMNAVQYPIDQGIVKSEQKADPLKTVGFNKNPGPDFYKKRKASPEVKAALASLRRRLDSPELAGADVYCLGNDSLWFVEQALGPEEAKARVRDRLYHPSAWWRKGGYFGRVSREKLRGILKSAHQT